MLFEPVTMFPVAAAVRAHDGASIGEVFSFLSGLYFRGKLAYAETFARPPARLRTGVFVITTNRGLVSASTRVTLDDLARLVEVTLQRRPKPRHRDAAEQDGLPMRAESPRKRLGASERLFFPAEFGVGRGDMSGGGLMLRCVDAGAELTYVPVEGALRRGVRPPKLSPRDSVPAYGSRS